MKLFRIFLFIQLLSLNRAIAFEDLNVVSLSNGACWFQNNEDTLKISSFNDSLAINKTFSDIEENALVLFKENKIQNGLLDLKINEWGIHCSSLGVSFVFKVDDSKANYCIWASIKNGKISLRSIGLDSIESKNKLCHGEKWGELLIGINNLSVIDKIQESSLISYINKIEMISDHLIKIELKKENYMREDDFSRMLKEKFNNSEINYIEYNEYRHPVGEYYPLK